MKKIKFVIVFFLIILATMMSSEFYQLYLSDFAGQFCYFSVFEEDNRHELFDLLSKIADENNMEVFALSSSTSTATQSCISIYASADFQNQLSEVYNIDEGLHKSFFSGNTKIEFHDFLNGADISNIETFYFTGTMSEVVEIKKVVNQEYDTSYVHLESANGSENIIYMVWVLIFAVALIFTWFDIQFSKKELFVRLSMGANADALITKSILLDFVVFGCAFWGVTIIYTTIFSVSYSTAILNAIFLCFLLINSALYVTLNKIDYKKVLNNANINKKMLANCYVMKAISLIVAILSLSINVQLIVENGRYLKMYKEIERYDQYSFCTFDIETNQGNNFLEKFELQEQVKTQIFFDLYAQGKVALATYCAVNDTDLPYIYINENTYGVDSFLQLLPDNCADFYVFYPSRYESIEHEKACIDATIRTGFEGLNKDLNIDWISYDLTSNQILFFSSDTYAYPFGFDKQQSPILIYCNLSVTELKNVGQCHAITSMSKDIMYQLNEDDVAYLTETYPEISSISNISVPERCNEYKATFARIVLLNTTISLFMILIEGVIVATIVQMEYTVNLRELMVRKILGHSIWNRNKSIFLLNLLAGWIGCVVLTICSLMFDLYSWYYVILSSILFILLEMLQIVCCVNKIERLSVQQVLKGAGI